MKKDQETLRNEILDLQDDIDYTGMELDRLEEEDEDGSNEEEIEQAQDKLNDLNSDMVKLEDQLED